jgi:predicted nucleic acid-binding protein
VIVATLDTGALIAMERRKQRGVMLLKAARDHRAELVTLTPVVSEWWRGRSDVRDRIARAVTIVPFPMDAARAAGVALGRVRTDSIRAKLAVDMMVVAFAALYGGALVYTSDVGDLQAIADRHFPSVRVLGV